MADPLFPSVGKTPDAQRLLSAVREFAARVASGEFPRRLVSSQPIGLPTGVAYSPKWGALNRVSPPYAGVVVLPAMRPETVNVPLYVAKTSPTGTMRVVTMGPLVNGYSGLTRVAAGTMTFIADGQNWWAS